MNSALLKPRFPHAPSLAVSMVGVCLKLEKAPSRGVGSACSEAWKENHMNSLMVYSFLRNKHLKMMDHNLMSVDREERGRHSSDYPRAREVGKHQLSLHLHRVHCFRRREKAAVGREQR